MVNKQTKKFEELGFWRTEARDDSTRILELSEELELLKRQLAQQKILFEKIERARIQIEKEKFEENLTNSMTIEKLKGELDSMKEKLEKQKIFLEKKQSERNPIETYQTTKGDEYQAQEIEKLIEIKELEYWKSKASLYSRSTSNLNYELMSMNQQLERQDIFHGKKESEGDKAEREKSEEGVKFSENEADQTAQEDAKYFWLNKMRLTITNNQQFLMENMKSTHLVALLHSKRCITDEQRDVIDNQPNNFYRNSETLQWMRSPTNKPNIWSTVLECLRESEQNAISDILEKGGVTIKAKITSTLEFPTNTRPPTTAIYKELLAANERIVAKKLNQLGSASQQSTSEIFGNGIEIVPFCQKDRGGITIWFLCHLQSALGRLQRMQDSGSSSNKKLKNFFAELSNEASSSQSSSSSILILQAFSVRIDDEDFKKITEIVEYDRKLRENLQVSGKTIQLTISGLTILRNELFVSCDNSSEVSVYDKTTCKLVRSVEIKDILGTNDIVSCAVNLCLYVFTKKDDNTWSILAVYPNGDLLRRLWTGSDWGRLSVSATSSIIFAVFDSNTLIEISPRGRVIREVKLSVECPRHALLLESGHFLVGYGNMGGLGIIDEAGKVVTCPDETYLQLAKPFLYPTCLAVENGRTIFVLDEYEGRVVLLTADLKYQKELFPKSHKFICPKRMCFDESLRCLFIAENNFTAGGICIHAYSIDS